MDSSQVGVWIACFLSVVALVIAYRTLTKDFVTKTELKAELAEALKETRHDLRVELNSLKLQVDAKLDAIQLTQTENARILGRIEGLLQGQQTQHQHQQTHQ